MINIPTIEQLNRLPPLYETEHIPLEEKIVHLHFTAEQCHWWAIEWDGHDTLFGYILLNGWSQDAEFGYFTFSELLELKIGGGLEVMNDPFWVPRAAKDVALIHETLRCQSISQNRAGQPPV